MAFTEALRLVVDADTRGAVRGVEKLGSTAARELSKSEKSLDRWGSRLTTMGTGMVTFGIAAVAGLGAMAKASEDARLSQLKLENTIQNMPKLAGSSADEFIDLAESIQKVTAADADAIVEGQALLGTFNLTAQEIKGITPLIVDYARKFGVDIPDAAVQVGKALDGQVGALKRNGVSIDEVLFKTDRYRAVSEALSDQVGGFAEQEGATFAGSLARLKNQLGDLAEGVGKGAVDAFTMMGGAVQGVTERLNEVSPGTQELVGKVATFGAVALIAAGGLSTLIGQGIKARQNFADLASGIGGLTNKFGAARIAAAGSITIFTALGVVMANQLYQAANKVDFGKFTEGLLAGTKASEEAIQQFIAAKMAMGGLNDAFKGTLDTSVPAAERFMDIAESMGVAEDRIRDWKAAIEEKKAADVAGTAAQSEYGAEVEAGAEAMEGAAEATENAKSALQAYNDQLQAQFDPIQAAIQSQRGLQDASNAVTEAEMGLVAAIDEHGESSLEAMTASDELKRAQEDAGFAALDHRGNLLALLDALQNQGLSIDDAKRKLYDMMIQSGLSAEAAGVLMGSIDGVTDAAYGVPERRTVAVGSEGIPATSLELINLKAQIDAIPRQINVVTRMSTIVVGSTNIPLRAGGGDVEAGRAYIVGEHRPELFVPDENGTIWPSVPPTAVPVSAGGPSGGGGGAWPATINVGLHVTGDGGASTFITKMIRARELQLTVNGVPVRAAS